MKVITGTREFCIEEPTVVTIGKFDGRHQGHQKLLKEMLHLKASRGWKTAVFTFDMAPLGVVEGKRATVITTNEERRNNMQAMGMDYLVEYPFNREVAAMSPERFVTDVLAGQMHAKAVVAGPDCSFGYKGAGNAELLRKMGPEYGFETIIIEKKQDEHRDISSTYVKEALEAGDMELVNDLLGYRYFISGEVLHGRRIGRTLGMPTTHLVPSTKKLLPPNGVYLSRTRIGEQAYYGVTNIGYKPTIGETFRGVETYLFDFDGDLYGENIDVELWKFKRPEMKFDSVEHLKNQMQADIAFGKEYFFEK